jgi:hypothetical protein
MSQIIAVPNEALESAGAIAFWRLSGEVLADKLAGAWAIAGLDGRMLPGLPSPEAALARAVGAQKAKRRLVRPLKRGGWAIVDESVDGADNLDWNEALRVSLDPVGRVVTKIQNSNGYHATAQEIRAAYDHALTVLSQSTISGWLVELAKHLDGVPLRDTGGVYFLPPGKSCQSWQAATTALRACSDHRLLSIPAMRSDDAVEAVLVAVQAEAEASAAELEEELTGGLGEGALRTRAQRCKAIREKVRRYEALLGESMEQIATRLEQLDANIAAAALAVTGND